MTCQAAILPDVVYNVHLAEQFCPVRKSKMLDKFKDFLLKKTMCEETRKGHLLRAQVILEERKKWKHKYAEAWTTERGQNRGYKISTQNKWRQTFNHLNICFKWRWKFNLHLTKNENCAEKSILSDQECLSFCKISTTPKMDMYTKLLMTTSARPSEIRRLQLEEIDIQSRIITIPPEKTKTKKKRMLVIRDFLATELEAYIREQKINHKKQYLFFTQSAKELKDIPVTIRGIEKDCAKRLEIIGCKKNVSPYSSRHAFITKIASKKVSELVTKELAGHSDIRTTQAYYHNNPHILREAVEEDDRYDEFCDIKKVMMKQIDALNKFGGNIGVNQEMLRTAQSYLYKSIGEKTPDQILQANLDVPAEMAEVYKRFGVDFQEVYLKTQTQIEQLKLYLGEKKIKEYHKNNIFNQDKIFNDEFVEFIKQEKQIKKQSKEIEQFVTHNLGDNHFINTIRDYHQIELGAQIIVDNFLKIVGLDSKTDEYCPNYNKVTWELVKN